MIQRHVETLAHADLGVLGDRKRIPFRARLLALLKGWSRALLGGRVLSDARADRVLRHDRAHRLDLRHERAACRIRPMLHRPTRLDRPTHALLSLGVEADLIYVDHVLTGTNRERPGLREALAACRAGDTLVVTKLDRLTRSLPDARAIADERTKSPDQRLPECVGL